MKICIIGWYGFKNAGDDRILYCIKRFFNGHDFFIISGLHNVERKIDEINKCDYVFLGGGGLILRNLNIYADSIAKIKKGFSCIGISVEECHRDNLKLINAIKRKSDFIYVRDWRSKELLGNCSKVIVGPDLTFLYPFKPIKSIDSDVCGVNLRPWHYANTKYRGKFYRLLYHIDKIFPKFQKIYPLKKWQPAEVISVIEKRFETILPIPLFSHNQTKNDIVILSKFFDKVPKKFSTNLYEPLKYMVGMRLHSIIFACQMGIPFISLSYQPKNFEFCRAIKLNCSVNLLQLDQLNEKINEIKDDYQAIHSHLLEYTNQQRKECWTIMGKFKELFIHAN
jgi:polysaccharide pyruvyl transferase WcaK-like protein